MKRTQLKRVVRPAGLALRLVGAPPEPETAPNLAQAPPTAVEPSLTQAQSEPVHAQAPPKSASALRGQKYRARQKQHPAPQPTPVRPLHVSGEACPSPSNGGTPPEDAQKPAKGSGMTNAAIISTSEAIATPITAKKLEPPEQDFLFKRAIESLRRELRTRPSCNVGVCVSSGGCFSIRQRTEIPTDRKQPEPLEARREQFDGPVSRVWHQPSHLAFDRRPSETAEQFEARVSVRPRYTGQHVVVIGKKSVPISDIYSQGDNRANVRGNDIVIKDFWAVQYQSGWRGLMDPRIRLNQGDRERDELFEPTEQQMSAWRKKYTNNGGFKKKVHPRFRRTDHKWLFKNHTDEAPPISQSFDLKELKYDAQNVYEDGAYIDAENEQSEDAGQVDQVTKPKPGQPWCNDSNFVADLNEMLPKGYAKLGAYQSGANVVLPDEVRLTPPRDLDRSTYVVVPTPEKPCPTYHGPKTRLEPIHASSVGFRDDDISDQGLIESKHRTCWLGKLEQISTAEKQHCEAILKTAADYDPEQHEHLCHCYEYDYRYYPGELRLGDGVFHTVKNTIKTKKTDEPLRSIDLTWGDAIRNTFAHVVEDVPPDGLYAMHKISRMAATRVYPVLIPPPIEFDFGSDGEPVFLTENGFDLEGAATLGLQDVYKEIRTTVDGMRTKSKTPATIGAELRDIVRTGGESIRYIQFSWDEIRGLSWQIS